LDHKVDLVYQSYKTTIFTWFGLKNLHPQAKMEEIPLSKDEVQNSGEDKKPRKPKISIHTNLHILTKESFS
jgi:hypothetical protein